LQTFYRWKSGPVLQSYLDELWVADVAGQPLRTAPRELFSLFAQVAVVMPTGTETPSREGRSELQERVRSLELPGGSTASGASGWFWNILLLLSLVANLGLGFAAWRLYQSSPGAVADAPGNAAGDERLDQPATPSETTSSSDSASTADPSGIALLATGYIVPAHQILVSPKVSGMLLELNVEEGMRVDKGDILAVIESVEYRAERDRADAALRSAQQRLQELENGSRPEEISQANAELEEGRERLVEMEKTWRRVLELRRANASTDEELVQAEGLYLAQRQRVEALNYALELLQKGPRVERIEAARADVQQAEADLSRARFRLENCTIRAPISGTILRKNAEEGNVVNPVAFNGSFSICDMADLADLEVDLAIQERDVRRVFPGQKCRVRCTAFPQRNYDAVVDRLMPIADRAKGAVPVRVKIRVPADEEGVYLKPEMTAEVTFYQTNESAADR
jgi:HlyD family secretion protein